MKKKIIKSGVISTIGAILAAVPIMGYLPFGAPYAAAMMCSYCYRLPGVLAMVASVLYTQTKMLGIKYALLILAIACVILLLEESGTRMKGTYGVIIATVAAALMEITDASMRKITKEDIIIVGGMTLAAICFSLLFYKLIGLYLSRGKSYEYKKNKIGKMEELMAYEDKLKGIGDSFIKLSKIFPRAN